MKIKKSLRTFMMLGLLAMSTWMSGQVQFANAELTKDGSTMSICLVDDSDLNNADVFDDLMIIKRLPAEQSGYIEFTINQMATSHVVVRLEEEFNSSINYPIEFNNGTVTYDSSAPDTYADNDVYRISRCGGEIQFFKNGTLVDPPSPITTGNFDQPLVAVIETISATGGADLAIEFPHYVPHCVPDNQLPDNSENFVAVKKYIDGAVARVENQKLKFWYKERYAIANGVNNAVNYKIYNWEKDENAPTKYLAGSLVNCYGPNWHQIDLSSLAQGAGEFYTLEISGINKGETYYIRFENL